MMKFLLAASLLSNVALAILLLRPAASPGRERLIIETHNEPRSLVPAVPSPEKLVSSPDPVAQRSAPRDPGPAVPEEFQEAAEKMEADREEFLSEELGVSEEKLQAHQRLREEFFREMGQLWQKAPMRELSFAERRQMIDKEEAFHQRLEALHGKKNWQRYQKFREAFNQKGYRKQLEDNGPFIFMGI